MKMTLRGLMVATAALCALASSAYAQNLTIKDGNGASQTVCTTVNGSVNTSCVGIASGADVVEGTQADAAYAGSGSATVVALLKGLYAASSGAIPSGSAHIGATNPVDSGLVDMTDPVGHGLYTEPSIGPGRIPAAPVNITTFSATTLVAASASNYAYVTDLDCENSGLYSYTLNVTNAASQSLYTMIAPAGAGYVKSFTTPLAGNGQMTVGTALSITAAYIGSPLSATISSGTYNSSTGAVSLTLNAAIAFGTGESITLSGLTGTGAFASLDNTYTTTSGTTGTTVNFTAATGLGTTTITGGSFAYSPPPTNLVCNAQGRLRNQ